MASDAAGTDPVLAYEGGAPVLIVHGRDGEVYTIGGLVVLKKGTRLYHWGFPEFVDSWTKEGHIDPAELRNRVDTTQGASGGGGVYVSTDPLEAHVHGPRLAVFTLENDAIFIPAIGAPILDQMPAGISGYYAGKSGLSDWDEHAPDWFNLKSPDAVSNVRAPLLEDFTVSHLYHKDARLWRTIRPKLQESYPQFAEVLDRQLAPAVPQAWREYIARYKHESLGKWSEEQIQAKIPRMLERAGVDISELRLDVPESACDRLFLKETPL